MTIIMKIKQKFYIKTLFNCYINIFYNETIFIIRYILKFPLFKFFETKSTNIL